MMTTTMHIVTILKNVTLFFDNWRIIKAMLKVTMVADHPDAHSGNVCDYNNQDKGAISILPCHDEHNHDHTSDKG